MKNPPGKRHDEDVSQFIPSTVADALNLVLMMRVKSSDCPYVSSSETEAERCLAVDGWRLYLYYRNASGASHSAAAASPVQ